MNTFKKEVKQSKSVLPDEVKLAKKEHLLAEDKSPLQPDEPKPKEHQSRYISKNTKNLIRKRSLDQCEYISAITYLRCSSQTGLQFDHVVPFAVGGSNGSENIRHLCPAYNRFTAMQFFGAEKIKKHLKKAA